MTSGLPDGTKRCAIPWPAEKLGVMELFDSSTTPLAATAAWTSKIDDSVETGMISVICFADKDGILYLQESGDGVNWIYSYNVVILGLLGGGFHLQKNSKYTRIRYENLTDDQGTFWIYVYRRFKTLGADMVKFPIK